MDQIHFFGSGDDDKETVFALSQPVTVFADSEFRKQYLAISVDIRSEVEEYLVDYFARWKADLTYSMLKDQPFSELSIALQEDFKAFR